MALPVYEMKINPDEGSDVEVSFVALVDKPAIERNFMTFNNQQLYFKADPEKRIISGPAMVADTLIYRRDNTGEYNVFFSAATIKEIALKFAKKGYAKNLNMFHDPNLPADGVTIFNSFVSDKSIGILPMAGFEDLPDGSWFISAKVENDEVWQKIKSGEVKGFSVEGNFSVINSTNKQSGYLIETEVMSDVKTLLAEIKKALFNTPGVPPAPAPAPVVPAAQAAIKTKDGVEVMIDRMEVGGVVMIGDAPAPAGIVELEDGSKITVGEGGVITAVENGTAPAAPEAPDFTKQFEEITGRFASYDEKFAAQEAAFAKVNEGLSNANATIVKLVSIVEKMAETATAEPASTSGNNFQSDKQLSKEQKLKELTENIQKLKN